MKVNISQVNLFMECQQKWYNRYVLKRVPTGPESLALGIGTTWHSAMEMLFVRYFEGKSWAASKKDAKKILSDAAYGASSDIERRTLYNLQRTLDAMQQPTFKGTDIIGVEKVLEAPLKGSNHTLIGRLDLVTKEGGKIWHRQHKAMAPFRITAAYADAQRMSPHELGYHYLLEHSTQSPVGGTIMMMARKSSTIDPPLDKIKIVEEMVPINKALVEDFKRDIISVIDEMELLIESGRTPIKNRNACVGPYGNSLCPYFQVCIGRDKVTSSNFTEAEHGYYEQEGD